MFFSTTTLVSLLSLPLLAFAACDNPPNGAIPYHVTSFGGHSPSGRPGNSPTIWTDLKFTDNNTCLDFVCHFEWVSGQPNPSTQFVPCSADHPEVEFYRPAYRVVQIKHTHNSENEQGDTITWTTTANGTVPYVTNCGASGVCNYGLPAGVTADLPVIEITGVA